MYKYLNVHPKGKRVGDCTKRAITKVENRDYMEIQRELNRLKKETGCKVYNDRKNLEEYIKRHSYLKLSFPAIKGEPRMNGTRFCNAYPKGRYILNMAGHWTCCIDGVIYDIWDCSEKCVYTAYKYVPMKMLK